MFGFKIKVQYKAHGKSYKVEARSTHREEPIYITWEDYISGFGNFPYEKCEIDILGILRIFIKNGFVVAYGKDGSYQGANATSGIYYAKVVEIKDIELVKEVELTKYLPKWKKYINEPYIIWLD